MSDEPTYEELRIELDRLRNPQPEERDFNVAVYLLDKIDEARRCGGVVVLGQKGTPDQHHAGAWVVLADLPTMSTPQAPCSGTTNHGPHYWQLVRQTAAPDGPVTLCPGVYGVMLARSVPVGQVASDG